MEMTMENIATLVAEQVALKLEEHEPSPQAASFDDMVKAMSVLRQTPQVITPVPEKGIEAARFIRAMAAGKADPERAARWAAKTWGADDPMTKILEASEDSAGGVLVPTQHSTEVIELLRERAVFRSMGPTTVPMPTGSLQIPKITGGATATYIGESQNIVKTEQTTGMVNLSWKKLAAIVPISIEIPNRATNIR